MIKAFIFHKIVLEIYSKHNVHQLT